MLYKTLSQIALTAISSKEMPHAIFCHCCVGTKLRKKMVTKAPNIHSMKVPMSIFCASGMSFFHSKFMALAICWHGI